MRNIKVYKDEKDAGLTDLIQCATATLTVQAKHITQINKDDAVLINKILQFLKKETADIQSLEELTGKDQPDLALIVSILVSAGWNLNDDIFTPAELWKARETANHKPINDGHDEESILGHIIQSRAVDKTGDMITNNPPDDFDIEVAGVLYKALPKLQARIEEIIHKANNGEMFVSMEAWFPDFAFGVLDNSTGETRLIARNEETAFLTKHLRSFGGPGEFKGQRIGRVLLDINFGGQGFVEIPANPESVIKVAASEELKAVASKVFRSVEFDDFTEGGVTGMDNVNDLKKALEEAQMKAAEKDAALADLAKELEVLKTRGSDTQIDELSAQVKELSAVIDDAKEKSEASEAEKADLQKQFDEMAKKAEESAAKLVEIEKDAKAQKRLAQLKEISKVEDEKATLAEIREWSDETFESVLKYAGTKVDETKTSSTEDNKDEDAATAALDDVKENKDDPDYQVGTENVEESEMDIALATANALCGNNPQEKE